MENVILMAGKINATGKCLWWKAEKEQVNEIGGHAIVENGNGYDLVEILGYALTKRKSASHFSNTKYENMKSVVKVVGKLREKADEN